MMLSVKRIESFDWTKMSEYAHIAVFVETWNSGLERISYALLAVDEEIETPIQYVTVSERDSETAHLQYGGTFEPFRNSIKSFRAFEAIMKWLQAKYKYLTCYIENTNHSMMKFAMKAGFLITGSFNFKNQTMLIHFKEANGS